MSNGIVLTNGHSAACAGPEGTLVSYNDGASGDPAMAPFLPAGTATYDACMLEFDVVASGDSIGFNYQFGSEEYRNAVCSEYTDVFAFFISGPGITGVQNMALVPGTNIPVEINSVNNGTPGTVGGANIANCNVLGAGSPFTAYYINNTGGLTMSYRGYTTKFRALHAVTPCDTYHLKLSIVDAGDAEYDSGVFLEGGSLTTNSYSFNLADSIGETINGIPHTIVKGCSPTTVNIIAAHANTTPTMLNLSFGGTAVNGVDVSTIPGSVTLPADSTSVSINIQGIPTTPGGTKTLIIYLDGTCGILDSVAINIMDTPSAHILTADTAVCLGQSFQLMVTGTTGLTYSWAPPTGLSSTTAMEPFCTPTANTIYTMTATLPGAGCPAIVRIIDVNIGSSIINILTPDTTICYGQDVNILVSGSAGSSYSWSPATSLNDPNIQNPIATPTITTTYTVSASSTGGGCTADATLTITVVNPSVIILTPDTTVCAGIPVNIRVDGSPSLTYSWAPTLGLNNPNIMQPVATPSVTTTYVLTAIYPGTTCTATGQITVTIAAPLDVVATSQIQACNRGVSFAATPDGMGYSYFWVGPSGFSDTTQSPYLANAVPADNGVYSVTVVDFFDGCRGTGYTNVVIGPVAFTTLTNVTSTQTINYGSSVQLNADNATYYWWMPDDGTLNNRNISDPIATPTQNTVYTVYGIDTATGCMDSAKVLVNVIFDSIAIPSAFTPNGDGLNDVFKPLGMKYQSLIEFSIYNRWGQRIFTTNNKEEGWDGTFNGVKQDMDVYNYLLIVAMDNGTNKVLKGTVTLIR
jgi:gliding motility-associated-like protein